MSVSLPERRSENLAMIYQEVLTVITRLRSNRQAVDDPRAFRAQVRAALKVAEQEGARKGYSGEDVRVATFAIVAFLDESILNSRNPAFADWARKPLQEELFGVHVAGEIFFRNVERLLARNDSWDLVDLLEVYQLCLLLGFRGRYGLSGVAELRAIADSISEKIHRIRGPSAGLSPSWALPAETVSGATSDPWIQRLKWGIAACWMLALLLFIIFKVSLSADVSELQGIVSQLRL